MYTLNLLSHMRLLSDAAKGMGIHAEFDVETLRVEVSAVGRYFELEPEFICAPDRAELGYTPRPTAASIAFRGWRPGPAKHWEAGLNKRLFKEFCARNDLRTPRAYLHPDEAATSVLVKELHRKGPRGNIRGPFAAREVPADLLGPHSGFFAEDYIQGDLVRAAYWDGVLASVEIRKRPCVIGDGRSTVRELIECNCGPFGRFDWNVPANVVRLQGSTVDAVLPAEKSLVVDIDFWSALHPLTLGDPNALGSIAGTSLQQQLLRAGPLFWSRLPADIRRHTALHVYAVVDAEQRVWFIDVDVDPYVVPHAYVPMLRSLFGIATPAEAAN